MKKQTLPNHISVKVPLGFLKHKWFLGGVIAVIVLAGGVYWFTGTPQYSMWQLKQAIVHRDADKAMQFIDFDKIVDNVFPKFTQAMMSEIEKTDDPWVSLGLTLGTAFMQNMKPMLKEQWMTGFKDTIAGKSDSENPDEESDFMVALEDINKLKLKSSQGKIYILAPAEVADDVEMHFIITRSDAGRFWQITDLDTDWDALFSDFQNAS